MFSLCQSVSSASKPIQDFAVIAASDLCVAPEPVEKNRHDDHDPYDDFLEVIRPSHLLRAVPQDRHDEGADDRAGDGARAAVQAGGADDDGRDDVQLEADRYRRVAEAK